jgi:MFS family permease
MCRFAAENILYLLAGSAIIARMSVSTLVKSTHRKKQWQVLLALGIGTILALAGDLTLYAVLPAYAETRGFDLARVGLILSANRLVRLVSNSVVGLLLSGTRRRAFVLAGFGLGAFSTFLYVVASGPTVFLMGRLLWGISWSLIYIGSYTMLMDITSEQDRGWGSGILQGFMFVGMAANPLLGGLLSDQLGFSSALTVCTALSTAGFLAALFMLPETLDESEIQPPEQAFLRRFSLRGGSLKKLAGRFRAWLQKTIIPLRRLLNFRNMTANFIYLATHFIGDGVLLSTLSLHLRNQYGNALQIGTLQIQIATAGGALLALRALFSALVSPLAGSLSDRARSRWSGVMAGITIAAAGMFLISGIQSPLGLLAGVALAASGGALIQTIVPPLAREINPGSQSGAILGLLANSADLGMALAPLAAYLLVETLSLRAIYLVAGFALAGGLPLAWAAARYPHTKPAG